VRFKNELIRKLAKHYGVDTRVVKTIVDYLFLFVRRKIADPVDIRPIRLRYLATFVPKQAYIDKINEINKDTQD